VSKSALKHSIEARGEAAMANSFVEAYHDLLREEIESLLERSKEHERRFAEISNEWQQLGSAVRQLDEHIDDLYSDGIRLAEAVKQQADQIKHLESSVNRLAEAILVITNKPQSTMAARLGGMLYWLGTGLAVLLLLGGIWLFYEVFKSQTREAVAWLLPIAVVILGSIAWLVGRAFCYVFAGR
jgi:septal ring factor EnvC (AmiA/AmiB activator)